MKMNLHCQQRQDQHGQWKALPYEAAGALVRTLMRHCHAVMQLRIAKEKALSDDPNATKAATKKLVDKYTSYQSVEKYMVFNGRTGQMASEMWLSKHIHVVDGKPAFKKATGKVPKILTLGVKIINGSLDLTLDFGNEVSCAQPVRCMDLRTSQPQGELEALAAGFGHLGDENIDSDGERDEPDFDEVDFQDENEYEDDIVDDSAGIEGQHTQIFTLWFW